MSEWVPLEQRSGWLSLIISGLQVGMRWDDRGWDEILITKKQPRKKNASKIDTGRFTIFTRE